MLRMLHGQPVVEGERRLGSRAVARTPDCHRFQTPLGPLPAQDRFVTANAKLAVASRARAAPFAVAQNLRDTLPYFFDKDLDPRWAGGMAERVAGRARVPVHGSKLDRGVFLRQRGTHIAASRAAGGRDMPLRRRLRRSSYGRVPDRYSSTSSMAGIAFSAILRSPLT